MEQLWRPDNFRSDVIDVFKETLSDIDRGVFKIDSVAFVKAVAPVFDWFTHSVRARVWHIAPNNTPNARADDFVILPAGLGQNGGFKHRVIRLRKQGHVAVFEVDVPPFKAQDDKRALNKRLNHILGQKGKKQLRAIDDIGFIFDGSTQDFYNLDAVCDHVADVMAAQLTPYMATGRVTPLMSLQLASALENHAQSLMPDTQAVLDQAKAALAPDVSRLISKHPKARSARLYNSLVGQDAKITLRKRAIEHCPTLLFWQDTRMFDAVIAHSLDAGGQINPGKLIHNVFWAKTTPRVDYYAQLTGEDMPLSVLHALPFYARHIEKNQPFVLDPQGREEWQILRDLVQGGAQLADVLERNSHKVFYDLARNNTPYKARHVLQRHFEAASQRMADVKQWRDRIITLPLVLKILTEANAQNFTIPVRHAFYMAAQNDAPYTDLKNAVPRRIKTITHELFGGRKLSNVALDSVSAFDVLERAHDFVTHHGVDDLQVRRRIITRSIDDHAKAITFTALPDYTNEFGYSVSSIKDHGELNAICREARSPIWYEGVMAVSGHAHFLKIHNRLGQLTGIAHIEDPSAQNNAWRIVQVEAAGRAQGNFALQNLVQDYLDQPDFQARVDLDAINAHRTRLYQKLARSAHDNDMTIVAPYDIEGKANLLKQQANYFLPQDGWRIDDTGCVSYPLIDTHVHTLITRIKPFYGVIPR